MHRLLLRDGGGIQLRALTFSSIPPLSKKSIYDRSGAETVWDFPCTVIDRPIPPPLTFGHYFTSLQIYSLEVSGDFEPNFFLVRRKILGMFFSSWSGGEHKSRAGQSVHFFSMAFPLLVTWKNQYGVTVTRYFSKFLRRYRYRYM